MKGIEKYGAMILVLISSEVIAQDQRNLSVQEFREKLESTTQAVILDVRTREEVEKGIIKNAIHIDFFSKKFESEIKNLDKTKTYFVYCAGGGRSSETLEMMSDLGFTKVYQLTGGFTAWKRQDMPVSPYVENSN
jgi:rhodanese-related sulfurtransferase